MFIYLAFARYGPFNLWFNFEISLQHLKKNIEHKREYSTYVVFYICKIISSHLLQETGVDTD